MKTLLVGEIHPEAEQILKQRTSLITVPHLDAPVPPDTEAIIVRTFTLLHKEQLGLFPKLNFIISCSVGLDNIDLEEAKKRNIQIIHCPGTNANSVAEHTLFLLLSLVRHKPPFKELKNKTVSIIGVGAIGKNVAQKLGGFEVNLLGYDVIQPDQPFLESTGLKMVSLPEAVTQADIITIHVPFLKATHHLLNQELFSLMKQGVYFINTSRAEVVDEHALLQFSGKCQGIALDVFSQQLKEKLKHPNLLITDHVAAQGEDSFREQCVKPVLSFLERIR